MGMRVLGTAGSVEGVEWVKKNGADAVFNHRQEGYTQQIMVISLYLANFMRYEFYVVSFICAVSTFC